MSAQSMCDIGYKQGAEFFTALEKAGFTGDIVQQVITSRGNRMAKTMYAAINTGAQVDDRFEFLKSFEVTVPEGYNHATRLDTFRAAHQNHTNKEFYFYNDATTDANYAEKATTKLTAGRKFTVKMFGIKKTVTSDDCLKKLRAENAVLVGAQGASLAYEQKKDELPKGKWSVSFDEKDSLWRDPGGRHGVPYVPAYSGGVFDFDLGGFEDGWGSGYVLLCFCDKESLDT